MLLGALLVLAISCNLLPLHCSAVTAQDRSGGSPKRYHSGGGYGHKNNFKTELSLDPSKIVLRCRVKEPLEHIVWVVSRCPGHHGGGYGGHHDRLVAEGATVNDPSNYDVRIIGGNSTIMSDLVIKKPLSAMGAGLYRCEAWPHGGGGPPYGYVAQEVYLIGGKELLKSCFGGWEAPSDYSGGGGGFPTGYAKSKHRGGDTRYSQYVPQYNMSHAASEQQHVAVSQEAQQREAVDPMSRLPIYPSRPMRFSSSRPSSYQQPIRDRIDQDEQLTRDRGELEEHQFAPEHPYSFENSQSQRRHQMEQQAYNPQSEQQKENSPREQHRFIQYTNQNSKQEQQNSQTDEQHHKLEQQQKENNLREQHRFRGYANNQNSKQEQQNSQTENVNRHRPQSQYNPKPTNQQPNAEERRPEQKVKPILVFAQPTPATPAPAVTQQAQNAELQTLIRRYHEYLKQQPTSTVVPPRSYVSLTAPHTQQRVTSERVVHNQRVTESPLRPSPADPGTPPASWSQLVARTSKSQEDTATDEPPAWSKLAPRESEVSQKSASDDAAATPAWSQLVARVQSRSSKAMYGAGHSGAVEHLTVDTAVTSTPPQE